MDRWMGEGQGRCRGVAEGVGGNSGVRQEEVCQEEVLVWRERKVQFGSYGAPGPVAHT